MTNKIQSLQDKAFAADRKWSDELHRLFGRRAGYVRYTVDGKGSPGSLLRSFYDDFTQANHAWLVALAEKAHRVTPREISLTLDDAKEAFEHNPSNATAGDYLATLMQYEADDMIGDDTFLDGLGKIAGYLKGGAA